MHENSFEMRFKKILKEISKEDFENWLDVLFENEDTNKASRRITTKQK